MYAKVSQFKNVREKCTQKFLNSKMYAEVMYAKVSQFKNVREKCTQKFLNSKMCAKVSQ